MAKSSPTENKILIIGAGATGLAIAQGLQKAGIPYALHERAESKYSKRNWTFGLHWGYRAIEKLLPPELLAKIGTAQVDPTIPVESELFTTMFNGGTGELLDAIPSEKIYRLRRDLFRNFLLTGLEINWNKKLTNITYSPDGRTVTAHFTDGTSDTGLALVGCDGAHSIVRTHLVGPQAAQLDPIGYGCAILFARHTPEHARFLRSPPANPIYNLAIHPAGHTSWLSLHSAPSPEKPEDWIFSSYITYAEPKDHINVLTREELLEEHKKLGEKFADPFKSAYAWAPDDSQIEYVKLQNWDPRKEEHKWDSSNGRVTLAGDGAHAMTFQRGQGLNNAVQDSYEYVEAVKKWWGKGVEGRAKAVGEYEVEMKRRGGAEAQLSAETTVQFHERFEEVLRNKGMKEGMLPTK